MTSYTMVKHYPLDKSDLICLVSGIIPIDNIVAELKKEGLLDSKNKWKFDQLIKLEESDLWYIYQKIKSNNQQR